MGTPNAVDVSIRDVEAWRLAEALGKAWNDFRGRRRLLPYAARIDIAGGTMCFTIGTSMGVRPRVELYYPQQKRSLVLELSDDQAHSLAHGMLEIVRAQ
jgi:hypothetical protein